MLPALRKVRWRTLPLRVAAVLASVLVMYLVLVNVLLSTGLAKAAINRIAPESVHVEWRTAYSPWFLRVHTTGFAIRSEDSSVQWAITTDRANATFGPFDFFSRRVRLHDTWARGVSTRIRFKLDPAEATPDYAARLPPIAGFSDPPLKPAVPPPPVTDENYRLWSVQIDDAVVDDVREAWVDTIRVTDTSGHVEGGFHFEPLRKISVRPTSLRTEDAGVFDGKDPIATELRGTFALHIAELDVRYVHGADALAHFDAAAKGHGQVGDLRFLDRWLHATHVAVAGGAGPTVFSVELQRGQLVSGSRAWARAERFSLWSGHDGISGTSVVTAEVPEGKPWFVVSVETYGAGLHRGKTRVVRAPAVVASARIDNLDLTKPFDRWTASVDVPSATVNDLVAVNGYLGEPVLRGGSATMKVHADLAPHTVSGHAKLDVAGAVVKVSKTVVTASGTVEATLRDFDLRSEKGSLAGSRLDLRDVSGANERGWWANLSVSPMFVSTKHGLTVSGRIAGKLKNAQLPLAILDAPGIVRTVFGPQGFTMSTGARFAPGATELSDLRVIGNDVEVRAQYRDGDGVALVETPYLDVGVLVRKGETTTHLFATRDWYAHMLDTKAQID